MFVVEVKPLHEPFPPNTRFLHFVEHDKILAISEREADILVKAFGGDLSGCTLKLSPMPNGNILIAADIH